MLVDRLIEILLRACPSIRARSIIESSVHLPKRGRRWVASFRDEAGRQICRTTGLTNKEAAAALARHWEQEFQRKRAARGPQSKKLTLRVRPGSPERELGCLTQQEVGALMDLSTRAVRQIEKRALQKLRQHPALKAFWREWLGGELNESPSPAPSPLTTEEIQALFGLTGNAFERKVLSKLLLGQRGNAL